MVRNYTLSNTHAQQTSISFLPYGALGSFRDGALTIIIIIIILSTSLNSFISTPLLAISAQLQDVSLMFLGLEILREGDTVSELLGMLLPPSRMPCLKASREVIPFSPSKFIWRLFSSTASETFPVMVLLVSVPLAFDSDADGVCAVSYTHLTLPTRRTV